MSGKQHSILLTAFCLFSHHILAQHPQENWYQEQVWTYTGDGFVPAITDANDERIQDILISDDKGSLWEFHGITSTEKR